MQEIQLKLQKIVIYGSFLLAAIMIFYSLGFSTNLYNLSYHADASSSLFYVPGAEIYREVQPFNRQLFLNSIVLFLICLTMFITLTHKRRLYYISNYITSIVYAIYSAYLGSVLFQYSSIYKKRYLLVDFEKLKQVKQMMNMRYSKSTLMLDAGMLFGALLIIFAIGITVNLVIKSMWMKKEKWIEEAA